MTLHKQYLAQVRIAFSHDQWWNAVLHTSSSNRRYAKTPEEAEAAIEAMKNRFPNDPDQRITESRIRVREVTDWEDVDEKAPE